MTPTKQLPADFQAAMLAEMDKLPYVKHLDDGQYNDGQILGFQKGAEWAAQHLPRWIPVEERLPEMERGLDSASIDVIATDGQFVAEDYYDYDAMTWNRMKTAVKFWMYKPTPPEK